MWIRDLFVEEMFSELGIQSDWHERIEIADIDTKGSLRNNARLVEQIDENHVFALGNAFEQGSPMPGIICRKIVGKKLLSVLAGNHRIQAREATGRTTVGGYVVTCSDEDAELITRLDNRRHGKRQLDDEADEHILYMHRAHGTPIAELARKWNRPVQLLQKKALSCTLRDELEQVSIPTKGVPYTTLLPLNKIHANQDVFHKAARMIVNYSMTAQEVDDMVATTAKLRSQADQLSHLGSVEQAMKNAHRGIPQNGKKKRAPIKTKLFRLLSQKDGLLGLLSTGNNGQPIKCINDIGMEPDEARRLMNVMASIDQYLRPLLQECKNWCKQFKNQGHKHANK